MRRWCSARRPSSSARCPDGATPASTSPIAGTRRRRGALRRDDHLRQHRPAREPAATGAGVGARAARRMKPLDASWFARDAPVVAPRAAQQGARRRRVQRADRRGRGVHARRSGEPLLPRRDDAQHGDVRRRPAICTSTSPTGCTTASTSSPVRSVTARRCCCACRAAAPGGRRESRSMDDARRRPGSTQTLARRWPRGQLVAWHGTEASTLRAPTGVDVSSPARSRPSSIARGHPPA